MEMGSAVESRQEGDVSNSISAERRSASTTAYLI